MAVWAPVVTFWFAGLLSCRVCRQVLFDRLPTPVAMWVCKAAVLQSSSAAVEDGEFCSCPSISCAGFALLICRVGHSNVAAGGMVPDWNHTVSHACTHMAPLSLHNPGRVVGPYGHMIHEMIETSLVSHSSVLKESCMAAPQHQ